MTVTKDQDTGHDADASAWMTRAHANLARMKRMNVADRELNKVVGFLAGCEAMELALDALEEDRRRAANERRRQRRPIEGQTVIPLPGGPATARAVA